MRDIFNKLKDDKRVLTTFLAIFILAAVVVTVGLLNSQSLTNKSKASASTVNITVNPKTFNLVPGATQVLTYKINTVTAGDKISGIDLTLNTTGNLQIQAIGSASATQPISNIMDEVLRSVVSTTKARIVSVASGTSAVPAITPTDANLPTEITFTVTVVSTTAGSGSITIDPVSSQLVGNVSTNTVAINSADVVNVIIAPTTTTTPVPTTTVIPVTTTVPLTTLITTSPVTTLPITTTVPKTTTVAPTTSPVTTVNPLCACAASNLCTSQCTFSGGAAGSSVSCLREDYKGVIPTMSPINTKSYCTRSSRTIGDADGVNGVDALDYFYYQQFVNGVKLPDNINPDFNGDGVVSIADRNIVISTLNSQP